MIWITPSSCAKDLTISEGTGATSYFGFLLAASTITPAILIGLNKIRLI